MPESFIAACMRTLHQQAFYNTYWKSFSVVRAQSEEQKNIAYRIRYQVYCVENQIKDARNYPDGLEKDAFDDDAIHFLLLHTKSGEPVGTLRVLLPDDHELLSSFELQTLCDHPLLQIGERTRNMFEISRFCMVQAFRRRPMDGHFLPAYYEQEWSDENPDKTPRASIFRRRIPYAPLGLMKAAYEVGIRAGLTNCITMVEAKQFHTLKRLGMNYRVLGPRLLNEGMQQPLVYNVKSVLDNMAMVNPECWDIVSDKGNLHQQANRIYQYDWQDSVFDDACRDMIMHKFL